MRAAYYENLYYRIKDTAPHTPPLEPAWLRPRAQFFTNADKISQQELDNGSTVS